MQPIQDLLNRIRWDPEFGRGHFEIAYYDRVEKALVRVPMERVAFPPGDHFALEAVTEDGAAHSVPLHRVREVSRDGIVIWRRSAAHD
jgi:uncharacterized protein (UPF0248 family)